MVEQDRRAPEDGSEAARLARDAGRLVAWNIVELREIGKEVERLMHCHGRQGGSFEAAADRRYGLLRAQLEQVGQPIGGNDLLIAAHALALRATLVTDNAREFGRIDDLHCENWLRSA